MSKLEERTWLWILVSPTFELHTADSVLGNYKLMFKTDAGNKKPLYTVYCVPKNPGRPCFMTCLNHGELCYLAQFNLIIREIFFAVSTWLDTRTIKKLNLYYSKVNITGKQLKENSHPVSCASIIGQLNEIISTAALKSRLVYGKHVKSFFSTLSEWEH